MAIGSQCLPPLSEGWLPLRNQGLARDIQFLSKLYAGARTHKHTAPVHIYTHSSTVARPFTVGVCAQLSSGTKHSANREK